MKNIILSIFFAFLGTVCLLLVGLILVIGCVNYFSQSEQDCPKGMTCCPTQNYDYIVVDSIGRRYRPVPCAPESYECDQCGDFAPALEADETAQENEMPVTLIYRDGQRKKKTFYFTYDCGYECYPEIRLERIK